MRVGLRVACHVRCHVQKSRDPEVDRRDDITFRHGVNVALPEATVTMTSSLRRERAHQAWEETQRHAAARPAPTRCSHGFHSTLFPTGNGSSLIDKPEVDTSRSRDGVMTSRGRVRVSTRGRVKPDIEMTRQQVLNVYVLNDRQTGSDVTHHVTRAPASRRAVSASPSDSNRCGAAGVTYLAAKSRQGGSGESSGRLSVGCDICSDAVPAAVDRQVVQPAPSMMSVTHSHPRTSSCESQLHRPTFTRCSSHVPSTNASHTSRIKNPSFYQHNRHQADICTGSSQRTHGSTESSINVRRKSTRDSFRDENFRLRPAYVVSASLSRSTDKTSGKNTGRKVDRDEERRRNCWRFTKKKNERRMLSLHNDEEFNVGDRAASGCVGTTSSTARAGTRPAQSDDIRGRRGVTVDRRQAWTTCPTLRADLQNCYQPRQSTSLQREDHRSRTLDSQTESWTKKPPHTRDFSSVDDDVDWMNPRWVKRQIHLPASRRRRLRCSDIKQLQDEDDVVDEDHTLKSERRVVNSRTDPHNVCFSRRSNNSSLADRVAVRTAGTGLVYRTRTDPTVHVEFTTDNNGNLLKVLPSVHRIADFAPSVSTYWLLASDV